MDVSHQLRMPRLSGAMEVHAASVMQYAVILDALAAAQAGGFVTDRRTVSARLVDLLLAKAPHVRGGWSYVQSVPELPPDSDDLAQVMMALFAVDGGCLEETCDEAVRLFLGQQDSGGGVPTWMIDPWATPGSSRIRAYLPIMGGWGVHPEVVANFACALATTDRARYQAPLALIGKYIEAQQAAEGCWHSKWYSGRFYATFKCLSALSIIAPESPSLRRGADFLRRAQLADASWGEDTNPNPLSTSFGILGLSCVEDSSDEERLLRAGRRLIDQQSEVGTWDSARWISFPFFGGQEHYGHWAITTAFCTKALLALSSVYGVRALTA